jgi:putative tryptophan/tyrosine transport system substrate-binding protein
MRRREFIAGLGGAAAWPLAAQAQQSSMPVIGFLSGASPKMIPDEMAGYRRGLGETGYVEGRNVAIEYRWADGQYDRLPAFAADLVRRQVTVITTGTPIASALAAKTATATIPIVFVTGADPVKFGLVASFSRPGGNATGVSFVSNELAPKQLELLRELVPSAEAIAFLVNPNNPNAEFDSRAAQAGAHLLNRSLQILNAGSVSEVDAAFATLVQQRIGALLLAADTFLTSRREQILTLARYHRIPMVSFDRESTIAGGLASYAANRADSYRQAGAYVGRILKGEKPADLPIVQPTKFELVINLQTAKVLGIDVPPTLLAIADEVIE